jgi:hypothetical protein
MKSQTKLFSSLHCAISAVFALAISGHAAGIKASMYQNGPDVSSGTSSLKHYVDWSARSYLPGHADYQNWTNPNGDQVTYLDYNIYSVAASISGRCLEISTDDITGITADPIIWIKNANGVWVMLSDDATGAHPRARIFAYPGFYAAAWSKVRLAAYNYQRNYEAFNFTSNWISNDYITCTANGSFAAAYIPLSGKPVVVRTY